MLKAGAELQQNEMMSDFISDSIPPGEVQITPGLTHSDEVLQAPT